jgi:hypothetical protein
VKPTVRISLDLELSTEEALLRVAEKQHATVSELVQHAVEAYLASCSVHHAEADSAGRPTRELSLAEKMSHLRFDGGSPHTVAENHDEFLYPLTGPVKLK